MYQTRFFPIEIGEKLSASLSNGRIYAIKNDEENLYLYSMRDLNEIKSLYKREDVILPIVNENNIKSIWNTTFYPSVDISETTDLNIIREVFTIINNTDEKIPEESINRRTNKLNYEYLLKASFKDTNSIGVIIGLLIKINDGEFYLSYMHKDGYYYPVESDSALLLWIESKN